MLFHLHFYIHPLLEKRPYLSLTLSVLMHAIDHSDLKGAGEGWKVLIALFGF